MVEYRAKVHHLSNYTCKGKTVAKKQIRVIACLERLRECRLFIESITGSGYFQTFSYSASANQGKTTTLELSLVGIIPTTRRHGGTTFVWPLKVIRDIISGLSYKEDPFVESFICDIQTSDCSVPFGGNGNDQTEKTEPGKQIEIKLEIKFK